MRAHFSKRKCVQIMAGVATLGFLLFLDFSVETVTVIETRQMYYFKEEKHAEICVLRYVLMLQMS